MEMRKPQIDLPKISDFSCPVAVMSSLALIIITSARKKTKNGSSSNR
jgi:hypothetical protein